MEFLFGLKWNPQIEFGENAGVGVSNYGAVPLFAGTLPDQCHCLAGCGAHRSVRCDLLIWYASMRVRGGQAADGNPPDIPLSCTVLRGLDRGAFVRQMGESIGLNVSSESALAAGVVMGIMIIPFVSSLSDDVINAVPQSLRDAAYGWARPSLNPFDRSFCRRHCRVL